MLESTEAWNRLARAERLDPGSVEDALERLLHGGVEAAMWDAMQRSQAGWRDVWRDALVTRIRRRLWIAAV